MSQDHAEVIERGLTAWNAGDMGAFRELWDQDAIMRPPERWPEPGPFVGRDAVLRQFEQMRDTWSADTVEPIAGPFDVDDLVVMRFRWRGSSHGLDVDMEATVVYGFRAGKVIAADFFWDHEQAMAAAGTKGKAGSA